MLGTSEFGGELVVKPTAVASVSVMIAFVEHFGFWFFIVEFLAKVCGKLFNFIVFFKVIRKRGACLCLDFLDIKIEDKKVRFERWGHFA